jgi:uncharacterized protein (DUF433 family)
VTAANQGKAKDARRADPEWLRAAYAVKGARDIATELACSHHRVYAALRAAGIPVRSNGVHVGRNKSMVPPELVDEIVARYVGGATVEQIARDFDLAVRAVSQLLEERGVKRTRGEAALLAHGSRNAPASGRREWPEELVAEVVERYSAGESGEALAAALGLPASSVYGLLRTRGLLRSQRAARQVRERSRLRVEPEQKVAHVAAPAWAEEALRRYAAGEAPRAIAVVVGASAKRVYTLLEERGVLRSRSETAKLRQAKRREAAAEYGG